MDSGVFSRSHIATATLGRENIVHFNGPPARIRGPTGPIPDVHRCELGVNSRVWLVCRTIRVFDAGSSGSARGRSFVHPRLVGSYVSPFLIGLESN